ncbi:DUF2752 domain-containing protein [Spirillospora sp. NPDC127200]
MSRAPAYKPPRAPARDVRALLAPAGVLVAVAAAVALVASVDPHEPGHYPACPFLAISGLYCPGCGGLRMVNSLVHGQVGAAFGSNPYLFLLLPVAVWGWGSWTVHRARGVPWRPALFRPPAIAAFLVVTLAFWVVRNLPFAHVLAP